MALQLTRRGRTVRLIVPVCPESGFWDLPAGPRATGPRATARVHALLRGPLGLVRKAGAAGSTACFPGGGAGHLVQVAVAHEADEDAAGVVVPRDARDHSYLHAGVWACGSALAGLAGLAGLLVLLGLPGRGSAGGRGGAGDERHLWLGRRVGFGDRFGAA